MSRTKIIDMVSVDEAWVGSLPANWALLPGRRLFRNRRQKSQPNDEQLAATQKYGVISQKQFMELEDQKVVQALAGTDSFRHVEADDFVISLRSFQGGIERSRVSGCVSPAYTVLEPNLRALPHYYEYLLKSSGYISALQAVTQGIREGKTIHYEEFGEVIIPNPPLPEQRAIAKFLDRETAKIDALVEEQRKLIELLKEKRQALITHVVTKGLDPNVKMKDSGIEWLGVVPEHWEVVPMRRVVVIRKKIAGRLGYSVLSVTQAGLKKKDITDNNLQQSSDYSKYQLVEPGEFVMNHMDLLTGYVGVSEVIGVTSPDYRVFANQALEQLKSRFLLRIVQIGYHSRVFFAYGQGSSHLGRWRLPTDAFLSFSLPVPTGEEQDQICNFLEEVEAKYEVLVQLASDCVSLLQERRSALISAAVTGKIDLRSMIDEEVEG